MAAVVRRRAGSMPAWLRAGFLAAAAALAAAGAAAQDRFSGSPQAPARSGPAPAPVPAAPSAAPPVPGDAASRLPRGSPATAPGGDPERQDFGVPATDRLRPSEQLHAPTPTSIPGGRIVTTQALVQWLQKGQPVLLLHAIGSPLHLPQALAAAPASQGGSYDDRVQREFGDWLHRVAQGDRSRLIVTYCQSEQCWGSYNAALRAIRLGYTNVHWYRGGLEAWQRAGLPLADASRGGGAPAQPAGQAQVPR